eukprot:GILI01005916.1.p1 GENE.GILI01005916.1~~GILI01005916.1.p1  ORF type:complete len:922 (+),score=184.96 GILI01005916.1:312-2768(+)
MASPTMRSTAHTILSSTVPPEYLVAAYKAATASPAGLLDRSTPNAAKNTSNRSLPTHATSDIHPPPHASSHEFNHPSALNTEIQMASGFDDVLHSPLSPSQTPTHIRRESLRASRCPSPSNSLRLTHEAQGPADNNNANPKSELDSEEDDTVSIYHQQLTALLVGAEVIGYEGSRKKQRSDPADGMERPSPTVSCCYDADDVVVSDTSKDEPLESRQVTGGDGYHSRSGSGGFGLTSSSPSPTADVYASPSQHPIFKGDKVVPAIPLLPPQHHDHHHLKLSAAAQENKKNKHSSSIATTDSPSTTADSSQEDHHELISTLHSVQPALTPRYGKRHCTSLSVVAEGTDPASRYVKAKLAMGTQRVKEGKGFDMSAFRVGCDTIDSYKKPSAVVFDAKKEVLTSSLRSSSSPAQQSLQASRRGSLQTEEPSFDELLKPTCTWDLIHSIPEAVSKINNGDILYRFCAKKYKDLTLEERVEVASMINVTGFKDELAENDQPILDFVHNKNSIGRKDSKATATSDDSSDSGEVATVSSPLVPKEHVDIGDLLVVMVRLVGILPRVNSREVNVDCVMTPEYQKNMAAPDEVFEPIDRYRTYRKNKHIIPFVFSFRFQMTGSEVVDEDALAEHAMHHDAKPTRIVVMERTKKNRGADSTIKSKAFNIYYDIPPRGISSITGKPLAPELLQQQNKELSEASERLGGQSPEDIPSQTSAKAKKKKHSGGKHQSQGQHGNPLQNSSTTAHQMIPEKPGGILCVHTAVIIRTSMPKVLSGMVEALGNKMGKQATGQIFKVRQFLLEKKLGGWPEMESGGDNPDVKFMWE